MVSLSQINTRAIGGRILYRVCSWVSPRLVVGCLLLCPTIHADDLEPFATDGCSEFPDGTLEQKTLWLDCCVVHDLAYWLGGTYAERSKADKALEACVAQVGQPEIATLMLAGVRVGGSPYWPTRFRWGYGWPYLDGLWPRGYRAVSELDRSAAQGLLPEDLQNLLDP